MLQDISGSASDCRELQEHPGSWAAARRDGLGGAARALRLEAVAAGASCPMRPRERLQIVLGRSSAQRVLGGDAVEHKAGERGGDLSQRRQRHVRQNVGQLRHAAQGRRGPVRRAPQAGG